MSRADDVTRDVRLAGDCDPFIDISNKILEVSIFCLLKVQHSTASNALRHSCRPHRPNNILKIDQEGIVSLFWAGKFKKNVAEVSPPQEGSGFQLVLDSRT